MTCESVEQAFVENVWKLQQGWCGFLQLGGLTLGVLEDKQAQELSGGNSIRKLSRMSRRAAALLFFHSTFLQEVAVADT